MRRIPVHGFGPWSLTAFLCKSEFAWSSCLKPNRRLTILVSDPFPSERNSRLKTMSRTRLLADRETIIAANRWRG